MQTPYLAISKDDTLNCLNRKGNNSYSQIFPIVLCTVLSLYCRLPFYSLNFLSNIYDLVHCLKEVEGKLKILTLSVQ